MVELKKSVEKSQAEVNTEGNLTSPVISPIGNVRFLPVKIKDFVRFLQNYQAFNGEFQGVTNNISPIEQLSIQQSLYKTPNISPTPAERHSENNNPLQSEIDSFLEQMSKGNNVKRSFSEINNQIPSFSSKNQQQMFALPSVTAYPMVGTTGYRVDGESKRSRKLKRSPSRVRKNKSKSQSTMRSESKWSPKSRSRSKSRLDRKSRSYRKSKPRSKSKSRSKSRLRRKSRKSPSKNMSVEKSRKQVTKSKSAISRKKSRKRPSRSRSVVSKRKSISKSRKSPSRSRSVYQRERKVRRTTVSPKPTKRQSPPLKQECCTPYPLCEKDTEFSIPQFKTTPEPQYKITPESQYKTSQKTQSNMKNKGDKRRSSLYLMIQENEDDDQIGILRTCPCKSKENLQFIQPGLCSKKTHSWTNEYAIITNPKIKLIDPSKDLDPHIHPIANRPCIRDSRGNPLTDAIGRPLRDPTGKRFLKFNSNGSVLDTSFRGNFFTGQPPLCVKYPLPQCSCGPNTTHINWLDSGYPIMPDMTPFFKQVIESQQRGNREYSFSK